MYYWSLPHFEPEPEIKSTSPERVEDEVFAFIVKWDEGFRNLDDADAALHLALQRVFGC